MTIPAELIADWEQLNARWQTTILQPWLAILPDQFASGLSPERYGDLPRWRNALANLPALPTGSPQLTSARVGLSGEASPVNAEYAEGRIDGAAPLAKRSL